MPVEAGADLAPFEVRQENAAHAPRQEPAEVVLAEVQGQGAKIVATIDQDIEGVELDLVIVPAAVQAVEVRDPVDPEQHGFAIEHKRARPDAKRGLGDQGILVGPVFGE